MNSYFLSVMENFKSFFEVVGILGAIICMATLLYFKLDDYSGYKPRYKKKAIQTIYKAKLLLAIFLVLGIGSLFIPTRRALVESHLIVEGSQIITVEEYNRLTDVVIDKMNK